MPSPDSSASVAARTVLVTGAGKRLGREIALTLARGGWNVAVHHRHSVTDAQQTAADCNALTGRANSAAPFFADLADESSVRALLPAVVARFGQIDAVVNSASTFEHDSAQSFGFAAMETHLRANTGAAVLLAQALHAHLSQRDARGAVVNLLDQKLWNMNPDFFSYTLSKAALEAANTMLAMGLAPAVRIHADAALEEARKPDRHEDHEQDHRDAHQTIVGRKKVHNCFHAGSVNNLGFTRSFQPNPAPSCLIHINNPVCT